MQNSRIKKIADRENAFWSNIFRNELEQDRLRNKKFSSYWWESYYSEITKFVVSQLSDYQDPSILEAGSGSGKASMLLGKNYKRTLLDISAVALKYSRYLAKKFKAQNIKFISGNIFDLPFNKKAFDFVWNIGVIEHYKHQEAILIIREMIRVSRSKGKLAMGVPNFISGPIIKARILKHPFFSFVPGYRIESENRYTKEVLKSLIAEAARQENRKINNLKVLYFGNPLPMETPKLLLYFFGKAVEYLLPKNKFLLFAICDIE